MSWNLDPEKRAGASPRYEARIEARNAEIQRRIAAVQQAKTKARQNGRFWLTRAELTQALDDERDGA